MVLLILKPLDDCVRIIFVTVSQYAKRDNSDNPHGHLSILKHALANPDGVFVSHNPLFEFQTTFLNLDVYSVHTIYLFFNEHAPPPFLLNHRDSIPRKI